MYRWKVYVLAVFLSMLAIFYWHAQLQLQADEQAQQRLQQWLDRHHGQVASSSYHVLRDRLHLNKLTFDWQNIRLSAEQTEIQLDQATDNHLRSITFQNLKIALPDNQPVQFISQLHALLADMQQLKVQQGQLYLAKQTWLHDIELQLQTLSTEEKKIEGTFSQGDGEVTFQVAWHQDGWPYLQLSWRDTDIAEILQYFGFPHLLKSPSSGEMSWRKEAGIAYFQGNIKQGVGLLAISGEVKNGEWTFELDAQRFDLQSLAFYAPTLFARQFVGGILNGEMQGTWHAETKHWTLESHELLLELLELHDEQQNAWEFSSVRIQELKLSPLHFDISRLWLAEARITVMPELLGDGSDLLHGWKGEVRAFNVDHLQLIAQMPEGEVSIPVVFGRGSMLDGKLTFDLQHMASDERWRLHGHWSLLKETMTVGIDVKGASLARFRSLLSQVWQYDVQGTTELMGQVDLKMRLLANRSVVRLNGDIKVQDLKVSQFGHQWQAATLRMQVKQLGLGLDHQSIKRIKVEDWNYQFALSPIATPMYELAQKQLHQWQGWQIGSLDMSGGSISVARRDATWLTNVKVHLKSAGNRDAMPFSLQGNMAQKKLRVSGTLSPFSQQPSFDIKASLEDVLPFFLNEWFQLSGIPHLVQGRVSTFLHLYRDVLRQEYRGELNLRLNYPIFASGTFAKDPFIQLTGFQLQEIIQRMSSRGVWRLQVPLQIPDEYVLSQDVVAKAVLDTIKKKMAQMTPHDVASHQTIMEQSIRLHEFSAKDQLSLNERIRLKDVANILAQHSDAIVILRPQLGNQELNTQLQQQIEYTQNRISRLLRYKGVMTSRIFPVWPGAEHRQGDVGGIQVLVQKVKK